MKMKQKKSIKKNIANALKKTTVDVYKETKDASMQQSGWKFIRGKETETKFFYTPANLANGDKFLVGGFTADGNLNKLGNYGSGASRIVTKGIFGLTNTAIEQNVPLTNAFGISSELSNIIESIEKVADEVNVSDIKLGPNNRRTIAGFTVKVDDKYHLRGDLTVNNVSGNRFYKTGTVAVKVYESLGHGYNFLSDQDIQENSGKLYDVLLAKQTGCQNFQKGVQETRNRLKGTLDQIPVKRSNDFEIFTVYNI